MKRQAHYLAPNKMNEMPSHLFFVDTEGYITKIEGDNELGWSKQYQSLRLGWGKYQFRKGTTFIAEKWITFKTGKEFWVWVDSKIYEGTKGYVFAHNWNYDFSVMDSWNCLHQLNYELSDNWIIDSSRIILTFTKRVNNSTKTIRIIDSGNYLKMKLEDIGECVGVPKGHIDNFETVDDSTLSVYCKNDVEILSKFITGLISFLIEHNLGNFKPTSAGLSFSAFRHKFLKFKIGIHINDKAINLERESYRGGRTEAFYIGEVKEELYKLDVNSQYPFEMKSNLYPTELKAYIENPTLEDLIYYIEKGYCVIANCIFTLNDNAIGIKLNDKLIFPAYPNMAQAITTPEIKYILKNGKINYIKEMSVYSSGYIFTDYVNYFYPLKVKYSNNKLYKQLVKLFLNSLYGKFGQNGRENILLYDNYNYDSNTDNYLERSSIFEKGELKTYTRIGKKVYQLAEEKEEALDSMVAIASHTTGYARMYLFELIKIANNNHTENNVYYTDTDSLFTNKKGYELLKKAGYVDEKKLGSLKLEGILTQCTIKGAKDYTYTCDGEEEVKIKGVKINAKDTIQKDINTFEQTQFVKMLSASKEGVNNQVIMQRVEKKLSRKYEKGVITSSKWVKPFTSQPNPKLFK